MKRVTTIINELPTVENFYSERSGKEVPNQFKIRTKDSIIFKSYSSIIAVKMLDGSNRIILDKNKWDYSVTTGKYRNQFLNEGIAETREGISNGRYLLANLN